MSNKLAIILLLLLSLFPQAHTSQFQATLEHTLDHDGDVECIAFSPDGTILATSSKNIVTVWETDSGELLTTFIGHKDAVRSLAFSPDGKLLASGASNTIMIWQLFGGKLIETLYDYQSGINSLAFSSDGKRVAAGGHDNSISIWDANSWRTVRTLEKHKNSVKSIQFIPPRGLELVSGSNDETVRIWRVSDGKMLRTFRGHRAGVRDVDASPDGNYVCSGSGDSLMILWDMTNRNQLRAHRHDHGVNAVAFSPDGQFIACGDEHRSVTIWDSYSGEKIITFEAHRSSISDLEFSTDGEYLATGGHDRKAKLWRLQGVLSQFGTDRDTSHIPGMLTSSEIATIPPKIVLISPKLGRTAKIYVNNKLMDINGKVTDDYGIKEVRINGTSPGIGLNGRFGGQIRIDNGENLITIAATDGSGNRSQLQFTVIKKIHDWHKEKDPDTIKHELGGNYALMIGVEDYQELQNLANPVRDVQAIGAMLSEHYNFSVDYLINPSKEEIIKAVRDLRNRRSGEISHLLIMFAGHGVYDEKLSTNYLAADDSRSEDPTFSSYISQPELIRFTNPIQSNHILLVFDACFSGKSMQEIIPQYSGASDAFADSLSKNEPQTRRYISSGAAIVPDGFPGQHSPFTEGFLNALRTYGGNDGILTLGELHKHFEKLKPVPQADSFGVSEIDGDFLFIAE